MKIFRKNLFAAFLLLALYLFASCEKHDGIYYYKSKCTAEFAGVSYIDQCAFSPSLDAIITPQLNRGSGEAEFLTLLSNHRGGPIVYGVRIQLYYDSEDDFFCRQLDMLKEDIEYNDPQHAYSEYVNYCREHRISYAEVSSYTDSYVDEKSYVEVNYEFASSGWFKITSYDKEKGVYRGNFQLTLQQGVLEGTFWLK